MPQVQNNHCEHSSLDGTRKEAKNPVGTSSYFVGEGIYEAKLYYAIPTVTYIEQVGHPP